MIPSDYSAVAFVHGRPAPHPIHIKFAQSVNAEFHLVDFKLRWHDVAAPAYKRYLSWLVCGLLFPRKKKYKVFMTEGMHFPPAIMKWAGLLNRKKQKVVGLIDDEALYFIYSGFYSNSTKMAMLQLLKSYDALICHSQMQFTLAQTLLGEREKPFLYQAFNGVSEERMRHLGQLQPSLTPNKIVFIGNGPSAWRGWYKGLDLLLEAFELSFSRVPGLRLQIIGDWDLDFITNQIGTYCVKSRSAVEFIGPTKKLQEYLQDASLYVHCGRGEAFGISVIEAMAAAVPAMVSEWTGAKEAVEKVSPELIFPLDSGQVAAKIIWFMQLPAAEKKALSEKSRQVVQEYTEEKAISHFQATFAQMSQDLGI